MVGEEIDHLQTKNKNKILAENRKIIEFKKWCLSENIALPSLAFAKWSTVVTPLLDLWGVPRPKQLTTFGNTLWLCRYETWTADMQNFNVCSKWETNYPWNYTSWAHLKCLVCSNALTWLDQMQQRKGFSFVGYALSFY